MYSPTFDLFHTEEELSTQLDNGKPYINLDYTLLYNFDEEYATRLMDNPQYEVDYLSAMASGFANRPVEIQLYNIPVRTPIYSLNTKHIGKLVEVKGLMILRSEKTARPTTLVYICPQCNEPIPIKQTEQWRIAPEKCTNCDNRKGFKKDYVKTEYDDYQWIEIQETVEDTRNGKSASKIKVLIRNHRVDSCLPGETITVTGIYKTTEKSPNTLRLEMETYIDAVTVVNDTEDESILLTDDDITKIRQYMSEEDYLNKVIQSIAPSLYGLEHVKEALAYQMCEGQVRVFEEVRRRGQFHILLAGSPGCGKSELGEFMILCHPKGSKIIGKGSTGVGITAAVVKEGERFVLKAGAMPLADNGFLFVDEIEKMNANDSGTMHPGMEQQKIKINKADISAELNTRCSVLAACNPVDGFWNDYKTTRDNLHEANRGLPLTLLDRFALTFVFKQNKVSDDERKVIQHIMRVSSKPETFSTPFSIDQLRKIFSYARTITVSTTEEVTKTLEDFCMVLFDAALIDDSLMITRRQPHDLIRLAEASARLHGRNETTAEDAENAKRMIAESLQESGIDPSTGKLDQSVALYGKTKTKSQRIAEIPTIIDRLTRNNIDKTRVNRVEFVEYASKLWKVKTSEVGDLLTVALRDGLIYCPTPATLAVAV